MDRCPECGGRTCAKLYCGKVVPQTRICPDCDLVADGSGNMINPVPGIDYDPYR
jgi:hypothetical protein